ncbi:putative bifunctional diguanylate cyclase/phosphodiesterase [Salinibacillus xinjiangensis]|uniref:EAL domain-containing protein n=1 Tax=Salinibacillus xinjiangensis TaxID=1229268 RepID=A0A6G1X7M5_9BACI|nr:GGDEF domain-containing phosphodiesterase [Salinibacillus xinjiangensis]MRG86808.1 EAL domain-containing protein [Salinibacillus xinjiangensis]
MKYLKQCLREMPTHAWFISGFILFAILWQDFMVYGSKAEVVWILALLIVMVFTYYSGLPGLIFSFLKIILFYVLCEIIESFMFREQNNYLDFLSVPIMIPILISVGFGLLTYYLKVNQRLLRDIFESVNVSIWSKSMTTGKVMISEGHSKVFGRLTKEFLQNKGMWEKYIHPEDLPKYLHERKELEQGKEMALEYRVFKPNGELIWIEEKANPIWNDRGEVVKMNGIVTDITKRKEAEEKLNELAYQDAVTGLPNRKWFGQYLGGAVERSIERGTNIAILMIDFDNFKNVNDTLGHKVGDEFLKEASVRIVQCLADNQVLSRQGGDEFLVLLEDVSEAEVIEVASKITQAMNEPLHLSGNELFATVSIGISTTSRCVQNPDVLLRNADIAMYLAKEKGKNNFQFYNEEINQKMLRKTQIRNGLFKAMNNHEYRLVYQPKVDITSGKAVGVEALLRWNPSFGSVSPGEFIPVLEETGMIVEVGEWVLREACIQCRNWEDKGMRISVAVNVSGRQLVEEGFVELVQKALEDSGIEPELLEIEITESIIFDVTETTEIVNQLKSLGVRIAIDDFGVGFSSLNVVKNFNFDNLKIDQSFLNDVMKNDKAAIILTSLIDIGKKLGTPVVVEGVETEEQYEFLKPLGVVGQGYYFSKPQPPERIMEFSAVRGS